MPKTSALSYDARLENLKAELLSLGRELVALQTQHQTLAMEQRQECADALSKSWVHLSAVVKYVNRLDKKVLYWYEQHGAVKAVLRIVGVNKKTGAIVERNLSKIRDRVARVEASFQRSGEVVLGSLTAVQSLNAQVTHYSLSSVSSAQREAAQLGTVIDSNITTTKGSISRTEVESSKTEDEITGTRSTAREVESARQAAQSRSESASNVLHS
jgi:hypothetical protein